MPTPYARALARSAASETARADRATAALREIINTVRKWRSMPGFAADAAMAAIEAAARKGGGS